MKQSTRFAFVYNSLGVPLAEGVLFLFTGWLLFTDDRGARDEPEFGVRYHQCIAIERSQA